MSSECISRKIPVNELTRPTPSVGRIIARAACDWTEILFIIVLFVEHGGDVATDPCIRGSKS